MGMFGNNKKDLEAMKPFLDALTANGYQHDNSCIYADDTVISFDYTKASFSVDSNFSGYYYERVWGEKPKGLLAFAKRIRVWITKPCSEHNQNELEKIIRILKSV